MPERLEHVLDVFCGDADSGVGDPHLELTVGDSAADSHFSLVGELDAVGEKIHQHLTQLGAVGLDRLIFLEQLDDEMNFLCRGHRLDQRGGIAERVIDRHRLPPHPFAADVDARECQDLIDETEQVTRTDVDSTKLLPLKLGHGSGDAVGE